MGISYIADAVNGGSFIHSDMICFQTDIISLQENTLHLVRRPTIVVRICLHWYIRGP